MSLLSAERIVTPSGLLEPGWLRIDDGRIVGVGEGTPPASLAGDEEITDLAGRTIVPGFVDLHVHGGGGGSYTGTDPGEVDKAVRFHRRAGTTRTLASLVTAPPDDLVAATATLADCAEAGWIAGIHLEGPFLSPSYCGAQDPRYLLAPDIELFDRILAAGRGQVRMITIAPELPGASELIRRVVDAGVIAAIGHSNASYAVATSAIEAGATVATHLFNGMRPLHHREPGIAGAALDRDEVVCELIADGHHLHPATVRLIFAAAGDRVALVTDAISAAGAPDGRYRLGPAVVEVRNSKAHLEGTHTLAGSTTTTGASFRHAVVDAGVDLCSAVRAACETPARLLGLDGLIGTIEPGKEADLVVLDRDLAVEAVLRAGRWATEVDQPTASMPD